MRRAPSPGTLTVILLGLTACAGRQVRYLPVTPTAPAAGAVLASLYLVGDGGEVNPDRDAVLAHLRADISTRSMDGAGPPIVVAFLGDNIYDVGAPVDPTPRDFEKLAGQVRVLGDAPNVRGLFLPGNHDWGSGAPLEEGRGAVTRQQVWLDSMSTPDRVRFIPEDGCPGPVTDDVGNVLHLVVVDTEWLLRSPEDSCGTPEEFYGRLAAALRAHADRPVVVLSHHPLASGGPHAGNVAPFENGPLLYYLAVKAGVSRQDLASGAYTAMRRRIAEAIEASGAPPLVHAAGHDHTLQVIRMTGQDAPRYQLVSGALAKSEHVRRIDGTRYATNGFGYMRLDFFQDAAQLVVYARDASGGPVRPVFGCMLSQDAPSGECPEATLAGGT